MKRLLPLLKYLDRSKITPEAVVEIMACLGKSTTTQAAAEIANAFRTRGAAGLVTALPALLSAQPIDPEGSDEQPRQIPYQCKHCGRMGLISITPAQWAELVEGE